tara:strand:- start:313 stop:1032 length:720 start_codon:yes stop_codon:yes gene_type:complete
MNNTIQVLPKLAIARRLYGSYRGIRTAMLALRAMPGEIANSVTHGIGFVLSLLGTVGMLCYMLPRGDVWHRSGCIIFLLTMVTVYFASTCSHLITQPALRRWFRRLDQGVIYLFIAGSYTPWAITYCRSDVGLSLLGLIWLTALTGFVSKVVLRRHVNSVRLALYMLLAWIPVLPLRHLLDIVPVAAFAWLLIGGACYTVGTIFWKIDNKRYNFHAIWHVMVMLGTTCHYVAVFNYAIP